MGDQRAANDRVREQGWFEYRCRVLCLSVLAKKRKMKIFLISLVLALLGGCADGVYVGPRLDFTPSNRPNYTFPPPKEAQQPGKNVVLNERN